MKRTFAVVALLASLGVLSKLALKEVPKRPGDWQESGSIIVPETKVDPEAELRARYPGSKDRDLVDRVLKRYRQTALAIEQTDGLRGLTLLDRLDLEAVFLYEKYPNEFRRLAESLTDDAAADLLLHWREYFGMKRADETDRAILISEVSRLSPRQRKVAAQYPNALPLLLADPSGVTELVERLSGDPKDLQEALVILDFVSLDRGAADLRTALRILDDRDQPPS
ncbi:hypothetical protein ACYOEI_28360, partial [Singulisphaera rosea]